MRFNTYQWLNLGAPPLVESMQSFTFPAMYMLSSHINAACSRILPFSDLNPDNHNSLPQL